MKKAPTITIVMPIYNGASTLQEVFEHLENQENKQLVKQLIMINDNSTDQTAEILETYEKSSSFDCQIITNTHNIGLANGYNKGIALAKTPLVITMHQDIVLPDKQSFSKIAAPLQDNDTVAASYPTLLHPDEVWNTYNYWQKALFSRFVNKKIPLLTGKFDCFNKAIVESLGCFDAKTFRTAGEDGDLKEKFRIHNLKSVESGLEVIHVHNREKNFNAAKYIKKDCQLAEAQGVLLTVYGALNIKKFLIVYFRPILVASLLIPGLNIIGFLLILCYAYMYTKRVFQTQPTFKNCLLFIINISLLFVATYYTVKGAFSRRQTL